MAGRLGVGGPPSLFAGNAATGGAGPATACGNKDQLDFAIKQCDNSGR